MILSFVKAALPWVLMGLAIAFWGVRAGMRKKDGKEGVVSKKNYGITGMCFGMAAGIIVGRYLYDNMTNGMCIGMCLGMIVGSCFEKKTK